MGNNSSSIKKINFEDMQDCISNKDKYIIINTLTESNQSCLINGTITAEKEVSVINNEIKNHNRCIIIYGKNCNDNKIFEKAEQLNKLGLFNCCVYVGGLFEWLCLQDIYGKDEFPTTINELDILKYKPSKVITNYLLLEH